jgi:hypothetical protein
MDNTTQTIRPPEGAACAHFPEFTRLSYFHGQLLEARDFQTEQSYFREKLKLHNRCLHGYGTVCGLRVAPHPSAGECDVQSEHDRQELEIRLANLEQQAEQDTTGRLLPEIEEIRRQIEQLPLIPPRRQHPTHVLVECGMALDCEGNELIVRQPLHVDLWRELSAEDKTRANPRGQTLYVSLCYCPLPIDKARPVLPDACGATSECAYGKIRDALRVRVTIEPPREDHRCETCCAPGADPYLLLARIDGFRKDMPLAAEWIHNDVRRMIGQYTFATITGVNWTHGAKYLAQEVRVILGADDPRKGIKIQFSRPVLAETITPGVIDLWVIEGGRGRSGNIYHMAGEYIGKPAAGPVTWVTYRQVTGETLQEGDRVLIVVRTDFILDACCRPVDGNHTGGRAPFIGEPRFDRRQTPGLCANPPTKYGPWASGNGTPGGNFESWFYVTTTPPPGGPHGR